VGCGKGGEVVTEPRLVEVVEVVAETLMHLYSAPKNRDVFYQEPPLIRYSKKKPLPPIQKIIKIKEVSLHCRHKGINSKDRLKTRRT
jgi:hypothetical protein